MHAQTESLFNEAASVLCSLVCGESLHDWLYRSLSQYASERQRVPRIEEVNRATRKTANEVSAFREREKSSETQGLCVTHSDVPTRSPQEDLQSVCMR